MPSSSLVWLLIELDWFLAGRTLYLFDQPAAQANQVEDVPTAEYFAFVWVDEVQAHNALEVFFALFDVIWEHFQLLNELPPFVESTGTLEQPRQVVQNFAQDVNWESTSAYDEEEKLQIDDQVSAVEHERDAVENKLFFLPLLLIVELK